MSAVTSPQLVVATGNAHKVVEMLAILTADSRLSQVADLSTKVVPMSAIAGLPEPEETEVTFSGNAVLKAEAIAAASGLPALADDSGIAVDAMGGAPGFLSARWCGRHGDDAANTSLLLAQMAPVPDIHRGARFVCAMALAVPGQPTVVRTGEVRGSLLREPRGERGFGYDPIFRPDGFEVSKAEMTLEQKNAISHRGAALRAIIPDLVQAGVLA